MSEGRWRISVTPPDWGEDHLGLDAIVAFVDEELDPGPRSRATRHAARCSECAAHVVAQTQARLALRTAAGPRLPSSLLSSLRSIPQDTELPPAPAGLAVSEDGQLVCRAEPEPRPTPHAVFSVPADHPSAAAHPGRPAPPQDGGIPAQRADHRADHTDDPADDSAEQPTDRHRIPTDAARRPSGQRSSGQGWFRVGTGVAVSGLALGALAFGTTAASPSSPAAVTDRGVLGGSVLGGTGGQGVVDARLRSGVAGRVDPLVDGLRELPDLPDLPHQLNVFRSLW